MRWEREAESVTRQGQRRSIYMSDEDQKRRGRGVHTLYS